MKKSDEVKKELSPFHLVFFFYLDHFVLTDFVLDHAE